ncbi:MAG: DNA repair protein RecN [Paludibacter sp.]|jgi:DNA repair protein RecN (Recombination protein N)|nr:DNA repair protein RecN [Paludibacter sp.]
MLKSLYIRNYALISELKIDFDDGFTSITGETGAGKSIIIGALSLILGQRVDNKFIKNDSEKCIIEAEFDISKINNISKILKDNDLDSNELLCTVRRELTNSGKSRTFVNDTPVAVNTLREISLALIDIHSQHDNLLLGDRFYQLKVVDSIARNEKTLQLYSDTFNLWQKLKLELKELEITAKKSADELDFIRFQVNQLNTAKLSDGEQAELESEQTELQHAEEIKLELTNTQSLIDSEHSVLPTLYQAIAAISKVKNYLPATQNWHERLLETQIELKDIAADISAYSDRIEFNPERLEIVNNRLSEIYALQKKYRVETIEELLAIKQNFEQQLQQIEFFDDKISELKTKISSIYAELETQCRKLSESRKAVFANIEKSIIETLVQLGIPNIQFKINIAELPDFTAIGKDEITFMFSANKNRELQAVNSVASGGEISRIMLAIKALTAGNASLATIIFDEIDTGISGETAKRMGEIMKNMSKSMQVIAITHLPQITAKSSSQFIVYKDDSGEQTQTFIQRLTHEERIKEIAQMISGKDVTIASLQNAKELLES